MKLFVLSCLLHFSLSAPAPVPTSDPDLIPRQASTSVVATATPGASGPSPAQSAAAVQGCSDTNLGGVTDNDIVNGVCKPFTLIFARGTFEAGNIGGIVGPPFVAALKSRIGASNIAVQGVNSYPADLVGFVTGGSTSGSANMAGLIQQTTTQCPNTTLCVSGYSQGAQVAHKAANIISAATSSFINSVVLFGDPDNGAAFGRVPASKVSTDCHATDNICQHGDVILVSHLDYCLDVGAEADFAATKAGF